MAICDSDDVYEPERVEALSELARRRADLDAAAADEALAPRGRPALLCASASPGIPPPSRIRCAGAAVLPTRWWPRRKRRGQLGGRAPDGR